MFSGQRVADPWKRRRRSYDGRLSLVTVVIAILSTGSVQQARAAGFCIDNIGTPGSLGTAGAANVTNSWGPDAAWANPAGLTGFALSPVNPMSFALAGSRQARFPSLPRFRPSRMTGRFCRRQRFPRPKGQPDRRRRLK